MNDDNKGEAMRKPNQVVTSSEKQPGVGRKVARDFDLEPTRMVMDYVLEEKIKPWLKNGVYDMAMGFLERWLFHRSSSPSSRRYDPPYVSYNRGSVDRYDRDYERVNDRRNRFDFSLLRNVDGSPFTTAQVERIKLELTDIMNEYHRVRVADFNQVVGRTGDWTDNDWVWTDCRAFHFRQLSFNEWIIDFDPPFFANKT